MMDDSGESDFLAEIETFLEEEDRVETLYNKLVDPIQKMLCKAPTTWLNRWVRLRYKAEELQNAESDVKVVFAGKFNSGKSSVINSIIGKKLLPVSEVPITSFPTYFQYGPEEQIEMEHKDGSREIISENRLKEIRHYEDVPEQLRFLRIKYPEKALNGVIVIDTPGFSTVEHKRDDETTMNIIKEEADAVVWVIDCNTGTVQDDTKMKMREVRNVRGDAFPLPIIIVANRMDELSEPKRVKCLQSIKDSSGIENVLRYAADAILTARSMKNKDIGEAVRKTIKELGNNNGDVEADYKIQYRKICDGTTLTLQDNNNNTLFDYTRNNVDEEWLSCLERLLSEISVIRRNSARHLLTSLRYEQDLLKKELKSIVEGLDGGLIDREKEIKKNLDDGSRRFSDIKSNLQQRYMGQLENNFKRSLLPDLGRWFLYYEVTKNTVFRDSYKIKEPEIRIDLAEFKRNIEKKLGSYTQEVMQDLSSRMTTHQELFIKILESWGVTGINVRINCWNRTNELCKKTVEEIVDRSCSRAYKACIRQAHHTVTYSLTRPYPPEWDNQNVFYSNVSQVLYDCGGFTDIFLSTCQIIDEAYTTANDLWEADLKEARAQCGQIRQQISNLNI